jgi:aminopeptidase N
VRFIFGLLVLLCLTTQASAGFGVKHYDAAISLDINNAQIVGQVTLTLGQDNPQTSIQGPLVLDKGELAIVSIAAGQQALPFSLGNKTVSIDLKDRSTSDPIVIRYQGKASSGLKMSAPLAQAFTAFSTSQWMPCIDAPSERATFKLALTVPKTWVTLGNGEKLQSQLNGPENKTDTWQLSQPMPSYLYGFVAGNFTEVIDRQDGKTTLVFLAPKRFTQAQIRTIFASTRPMLSFYEEKSGVPYPHATYGQVLVHGSAAQEMATYSIMGERYGDGVLKDATQIWLGSHELAHQWWGNAVTNHDWHEMWLNEGIATFMNTAFLERAFGKAEYTDNIDGARKKYESIRDAGNDKALIFKDWTSPSKEDRALVYDKGSYVVHLLREQLGEDAFWAGIRLYTQRHWSQAVRSSDFQAAMQDSAKTNLQAFFDRWVYSPSKAGDGPS